MPRKLCYHHSTQKKKVKNGKRKQETRRRETKKGKQRDQEESTTIQQNTASILNAIQTPQNFSDSRFPDLTATECRGARSTCGRVSGLGFFHDFRYGCYVTKGLQDWSSFALYLVSVDPCISILAASMLNHLEPHPYVSMLDIDIDG